MIKISDDIKKIEGFENYYIKSNGDVISTKHTHEKILSTFIDNVGYKQVILQKCGKRYYKRVHRLVAEAFLEKENSDYNMINHKDGNKLNNDLSNLEWCSNQQNTQHAYNNNLFKSTYRCSIIAINKETGEEKEYKSIRSCAKDLNINRKTLTSILKEEKNNNYNYHFRYKE